MLTGDSLEDIMFLYKNEDIQNDDDDDFNDKNSKNNYSKFNRPKI